MTNDTDRDLRIEMLPVASLERNPRDARTHSKKQIRQIGDSIREFGFTNPVLIDGKGRIVAGHGRVAAAKLIGLDFAPAIRLEGMTDAQVRAYVIADNRLAENAGWDKELLALELQYLSDLQIEFDPTITGFEVPEIDILIEGLDASGSDDEADRIPHVDEATAVVSRVGELWQLGRHRLLCGDATKAE